MSECLETRKTNCKNCYKCIRHCPIKSIKFTDGQAHIMRDECILCGMCYVVCPQDAKRIRYDVDAAKELIKSGKPVYVSLAPSFAAWYHGASVRDVEAALKKLGFAGAAETAVGAAIVKKEYEKMLKKHEKSIIISSCCHSINTLIQKHYTNALPYLAPVITPMEAHARKIKEENENARVVFIGPCISKKAESEKYPDGADCVLTFTELDEWLAREGIDIERTGEDDFKGRTRRFPTCGGILDSMDKPDDYEYVAIDGTEDCMRALESIDKGELKNCFIEMSSCSGSCIGGPVMKRRNTNPVEDKINISKYSGVTDFETDEVKEIRREYGFEGTSKVKASNATIEEILRKMGKSSKEHELNCGSCGYNTCREKAEAVFLGKADLSMCLPYLKEKAESFSDKIINNTPNGIIVLNDSLEIQQINRAGLEILNLPPSADIVGSPIVRLLDPVDYVMALGKEQNVYDKKKYLAEYNKYVEETIIFDKEYGFLMLLMKDVTEDERQLEEKEMRSKTAVEITDKVVEKQMRVVQEIASLLGETTAETKIALTKLKDTLSE
ncbi:MAG: 4Fe-4S binding protein [Clostridia bacterium]|nr:4Fe-4S binding protein [Clostridia bacterium]